MLKNGKNRKLFLYDIGFLCMRLYGSDESKAFWICRQMHLFRFEKKRTTVWLTSSGSEVSANLFGWVFYITTEHRKINKAKYSPSLNKQNYKG